MVLSFRQRYRVISFSFASKFLRTFIFFFHGLWYHDVFFSLWCFIKKICVFLWGGRYNKMWIQFCLLFKPNTSFYTHDECINSNTNIVCVLHFWLAFITFFLLVLTSKWPSIIVNNNIMPQIIFKKKIFVKFNVLRLNYVDLFWIDYFVFFETLNDNCITFYV